MRIAVVIPTRDEADRVGTALRSALAPGVDRIVVDGGSRDGTRERAREMGARVIESASGRSRQLQAGFAEARAAEVVVFLHADTTLPSGWAERVRSSLADPGVVGGAFAFAFDETSPALRLVEWGTRLRTKLLGRPYGDQAIFARRAVLDALGGVPQAALMEDLDLVRRLRSAGRLALLPDRVTTSARRYRRAGVWRTVARHQLALLADALGVERSRIASWLGR